MENNIVIFENRKIRKTEYKGEWYYSVVDIIAILIEQNDYQKARKYWNKLSQRLRDKENSQLVTNCHQLKLISQDGKMRETDCANRETIFRLIQSVPSPNAEPFKLWFAKLAEERIQEVINPELAIERARKIYLKKGYTEEWTDTRIKGITIRNELTNEWQKRGATTAKDFAILTDDINIGTFGISTNEHKNIKKLNNKQNLRDNMSPLELVLTSLAEVTTTELHKTNDSKGMTNLRNDAQEGGEIASITRKNIEEKLGKKVITEENALDFTNQKRIK